MNVTSKSSNARTVAPPQPRVDAKPIEKKPSAKTQKLHASPDIFESGKTKKKSAMQQPASKKTNAPALGFRAFQSLKAGISHFEDSPVKAKTKKANAPANSNKMKTADANRIGKLSPQETTRLKQLQHADKLAPLASAAYDDAVTPKGFKRASTDAAALKKLGISAEDLTSKDPKSAFKAEVFLPVDGKGKPIVAFRGTNKPQDFKTDLRQLVGLRDSSYDQAMSLAVKLKNNGVDAEFTGHSLGGGLAAAAARATNKEATTFNAAGLHPNTVQDYLDKNNLPHLHGSRVTNFANQGDILNVLQSDPKALGPETAKVISRLADSAETFAADKTLGASRKELPETTEFLATLGKNAEALRTAPPPSGETVLIPTRDRNGKPSDTMPYGTARLAILENKIASAWFGDPGKAAAIIDSLTKTDLPYVVKTLEESVRRHGAYAEAIVAEKTRLEAKSGAF
jgi:hypothetical protein